MKLQHESDTFTSILTFQSIIYTKPVPGAAKVPHFGVGVQFQHLKQAYQLPTSSPPVEISN